MSEPSIESLLAAADSATSIVQPEVPISNPSAQEGSSNILATTTTSAEIPLSIQLADQNLTLENGQWIEKDGQIVFLLPDTNINQIFITPESFGLLQSAEGIPVSTTVLPEGYTIENIESNTNIITDNSTTTTETMVNNNNNNENEVLVKLESVPIDTSVETGILKSTSDEQTSAIVDLINQTVDAVDASETSVPKLTENSIPEIASQILDIKEPVAIKSVVQPIDIENKSSSTIFQLSQQTQVEMEAPRVETTKKNENQVNSNVKLCSITEVKTTTNHKLISVLPCITSAQRSPIQRVQLTQTFTPTKKNYIMENVHAHVQKTQLANSPKTYSRRNIVWLTPESELNGRASKDVLRDSSKLTTTIELAEGDNELDQSFQSITEEDSNSINLPKEYNNNNKSLAVELNHTEKMEIGTCLIGMQSSMDKVVDSKTPLLPKKQEPLNINVDPQLETEKTIKVHLTSSTPKNLFVLKCAPKLSTKESENTNEISSKRRSTRVNSISNKIDSIKQNETPIDSSVISRKRNHLNESNPNTPIKSIVLETKRKDTPRKNVTFKMDNAIIENKEKHDSNLQSSPTFTGDSTSYSLLNDTRDSSYCNSYVKNNLNIHIRIQPAASSLTALKTECNLNCQKNCGFKSATLLALHHHSKSCTGNKSLRRTIIPVAQISPSKSIIVKETEEDSHPDNSPHHLEGCEDSSEKSISDIPEDDSDDDSDDDTITMNGFAEKGIAWVDTKIGLWPALIMKIFPQTKMVSLNLIEYPAKPISTKVSVNSLYNYDDGLKKRNQWKESEQLLKAVAKVEAYSRKILIGEEVNTLKYFSFNNNFESLPKLSIDSLKITNFIISGKVEAHLIGIFKETIDSERHKKFSQINKDNQLKQKGGFGPIRENQQQEELIEYCTNLFKSQLKSDLPDFSYFFNVWIPEAIIKSINRLYSIDCSMAEEIFQHESSKESINNTDKFDD
ncbi:nucleosome binding [Blomia tropicalis]|nr:nucleosome binding [Blomia tropicalis]